MLLLSVLKESKARLAARRSSWVVKIEEELGGPAEGNGMIP